MPEGPGSGVSPPELSGAVSKTRGLAIGASEAWASADDPGAAVPQRPPWLQALMMRLIRPGAAAGRDTGAPATMALAAGAGLSGSPCHRSGSTDPASEGGPGSLRPGAGAPGRSRQPEATDATPLSGPTTLNGYGQQALQRGSRASTACSLCPAGTASCSHDQGTSGQEASWAERASRLVQWGH